MTKSKTWRLDVHTHYGRWPFPIQSDTLAAVRRLMERFEIAACVMSSAEAIVNDMVAGNSRLSEAIRNEAGLYGYVVVNPHYPEESREELNRHLDGEKFVGVKIHCGYCRLGCGAPAMQALFEEVAARGRPLLIHAGAGDWPALSALAERAPHLAIILAHGLFLDWETAVAGAAEHPNVYLDFCSSFTPRPKIEAARERAGANKMLFGSDLTLLSPAFVLGPFEEVGLSETEKALVYHGNAARVFPALARRPA